MISPSDSADLLFRDWETAVDGDFEDWLITLDEENPSTAT